MVDSKGSQETKCHCGKGQIKVLVARTHKFRIQTLKNANKALSIDRENHNNLRCDAIAQKMKNVHVAFEEYNKSQGLVPTGYKRLDCHMIFDV